MILRGLRTLVLDPRISKSKHIRSGDMSGDIKLYYVRGKTIIHIGNICFNDHDLLGTLFEGFCL